MELNLDPTTRKITTDRGRTVSVATAKLLFETTNIADCNLAFQRLANLGFDFDALDLAYQEMER